MAKVELKQPVVQAIAEDIKDAASVVLVDYRGLTVAEDTALRKQLREAGVIYKVCKNTMMKRAFEGTDFAALDEHLEGPSAIAISKDDATAPARIICNFAKDAKALELKAGVVEGVVYSANSPMGMSLPPYLGSVTAVVANADADNMMVGHFGDDLTDETNKLQLNISDETRILNMEGAKIKLSAADVKNRDALVFYDITTRSIPAQTTPSLVLLLPQAEEAGEEMENEPKMQVQMMVPLREAAKENGYTVKWQGKQKPIVLEKDGTSIEITLGSAEYVVEGDMVMKVAMPSELKDGKTYVSSEIFN